MAWFESTNTPGKRPDPIPLVAFQPGSLYREAMFERIEHENAAGTAPISAAAFTACWSRWKPDSACRFCRESLRSDIAFSYMRRRHLALHDHFTPCLGKRRTDD
jgi:hypothetical protein